MHSPKDVAAQMRARAAWLERHAPDACGPLAPFMEGEAEWLRSAADRLAPSMADIGEDQEEWEVLPLETPVTTPVTVPAPSVPVPA